MNTTEPHVPTRQEYAVTSDGTRVPLLVHRPDQPRGWLVWAHGGSWQHGSARQWAPVTSRIASLSGWAVVSVDYRLAPDYHHPSAVLDMLAALGWAEQGAGELPVTVGGDSAGGTIAALASLARRDTGGRVPPQLLAYPPLDPECAARSYVASPTASPDRRELRASWQLWLGDQPAHPTVPATPLQVDSLAGLAPVTLVVGADDPVRDDVHTYAARLRDSGVATRVRTLDDTGHADILDPTGRTLHTVVTELNECSTHHSPKGHLP